MISRVRGKGNPAQNVGDSQLTGQFLILNLSVFHASSIHSTVFADAIN
jgi:hypothetical protein